jgi:hypothetical protein
MPSSLAPLRMVRVGAGGAGNPKRALSLADGDHTAGTRAASGAGRAATRPGTAVGSRRQQPRSPRSASKRFHSGPSGPTAKRRPRRNPPFPAGFVEPSAGLEPATPSLPWQSGCAGKASPHGQNSCTRRESDCRSTPQQSACLGTVRYPLGTRASRARARSSRRPTWRTAHVCDRAAIGQPLPRAADAYATAEKRRSWILATTGHGEDWAREGHVRAKSAAASRDGGQLADRVPPYAADQPFLSGRKASRAW